MLTPGFYPSLCTIQTPVLSQDDANQPRPAWPNLAGHVALACRLSPLSGTERKSTNQVYTRATHVINLAGNYPTIAEKMRAVIDDIPYDILLVENDGQDKSTRLVAQVVT